MDIFNKTEYLLMTSCLALAVSILSYRKILFATTELINDQWIFWWNRDQLIWSVNSLTGFYNIATLIVNELREEYQFEFTLGLMTAQAY